MTGERVDFLCNLCGRRNQGVPFEGMTLEMRMFSEPDLLRRLATAGFRSAEVRIDHAPGFGIMWPIDYAVPIVARA